MTAAQRTRARTGPYPYANADLRQALHEWADAEARKRRPLPNRDYKVCNGCGTDREHRTTGCKTCNDRHYKWARRHAAEAVSLPAYGENG